ADALRERHGAIVTFLGSSDGPDSELVPAAGYPFTALRVVSAQKRVSMRSVRALRMTLLSARRCRPVVVRADAVVGIGGYASAPAALAARRARRPLVLVEPNSVPGAVNRIAARWASAVAVTFEATRALFPARVRVVGTIDRMELALAIADVAVSRAGAGHIAELTVCGVPMILVPYPHATEHHQEANARELEQVGAAAVATEPHLTADALVRRIVGLTDDDP